MSLEFVNPGEQPATLNTMLYGPPGVGKTTAACSAPGPVLVVEAESGNPLSFARRKHGNDRIREVAFTGGAMLDEVGLYLREGGGGEHTVVIDSLGEVFRVVVEELATDGHPNLRGRPSLENYGDATVKVERFCRFLVDLPVNVVLVAHELTVKDDHEGHFERLPYTGTGNPALGVKLMAMVDVVAYCGRTDPAAEGGDPVFMGQLFNGGGRRGKDRTALLGSARELDLAEWVAVASAPEPTPKQSAPKAAGNGSSKSKTKAKGTVKA